MTSNDSYGRSNLADIFTPFVFNQWYVAALGSEINRQLMERFILDRSIVFYRKEDGSPVALQNRCAHRSFPLHTSQLEGDEIRCSYHGIKYNVEGQIIEVPCQDFCPKVSIRRYELREIGPFVWIWMGEPEAADDSQIPEKPVHDQPDWTVIVGDYNHVDGNYLLMHENLCDLSHLPYLHANTFGTSKGYAEIPLTVKKIGNGVDYHRRSNSRWDLIKFMYPPSFDFTDAEFEHRSGGAFLTPAMCQGYGKLTPENDKPKMVHNVNHFLTPERQNSCHYYWYVARNYGLDDEGFSSRFRKLVTAGFEEDKVAVRSMQHMLTTDKHTFREMNIAGDKAGIMMRMAIRELVDEERGSTE
jgi:vanillate O-demethylase monooxygenase subunit